MLTYSIEHDQDPESPRDWETLGTMVCAHKRYRLGDVQADREYPNADSWDEIKAQIEQENGPCIMLPLYLYDHGGMTMSTAGFNCPWDSGMVGIIYCPRERALGEYSSKRLTKTIRERVVRALTSEVEEYDKYLTGDVWGYVIEDAETGEHIDSCWGMFGYDYCEQEARAAVAASGHCPMDCSETEATLA